MQTKSVQYSPSAMDGFTDCEARFWFDQHPDGAGTLATDSTAADLSGALHDALMDYHRQLEQLFTSLTSHLPDGEECLSRLQRLLERHMRRRRLSGSDPALVDRMAKLQPGVERVAGLVRADMEEWQVDPDTGELLVWAEAPLDHGPGVRAVEISPGFLSRTRPDIIGIRKSSDGAARVLIRDYKGRSAVVDPRFDNGILVRAMWAYAELKRPRCEWFIRDRSVDVDRSVIDLETVNILHSGSPEFLVQASVTGAELDAERERLTETLSAMAETGATGDVSAVPANPGGLCRNYCPHLHRCAVGQAHVRKYAGDSVLTDRMAEAPTPA